MPHSASASVDVRYAYPPSLTHLIVADTRFSLPNESTSTMSYRASSR